MSDDAATEPGFVMVRLGKSPEESVSDAAGVVGSTIARRAPVPMHWLALPHEAVLGTMS